MGVSQELIMASAITEDPTKLLMAVPATIMGVGAIAKSFALVHQNEVAILTRKGAPRLKPEISQRIINEIADELPDLRTRYSRRAPVNHETIDLSDLREYDLSDSPENWVDSRRNSARMKVRRLDKNERRKRVNEKIDGLPDEVAEEGIYQIAGQGIVPLIPFIDRAIKISVAHQTTPLETFPLDSQDGVTVGVESAITWNVNPSGDNPYYATFRINNDKETKIKDKTKELEQTVAWICTQGMGLVLRGRSYQQLNAFDPKEVTASMQKVCRADLARFGVNLGMAWLNLPARTPAERIAQAIERGVDPAAIDHAADPAAAKMIAAAAFAGAEGVTNVLDFQKPKPAA